MGLHPRTLLTMAGARGQLDIRAFQKLSGPVQEAELGVSRRDSGRGRLTCTEPAWAQFLEPQTSAQLSWLPAASLHAIGSQKDPPWPLLAAELLLDRMSDLGFLCGSMVEPRELSGSWEGSRDVALGQ